MPRMAWLCKAFNTPRASLESMSAEHHHRHQCGRKILLPSTSGWLDTSIVYVTEVPFPHKRAFGYVTKFNDLDFELTFFLNSLYAYRNAKLFHRFHFTASVSLWHRVTRIAGAATLTTISDNNKKPPRKTINRCLAPQILRQTNSPFESKLTRLTDKNAFWRFQVSLDKFRFGTSG